MLIFVHFEQLPYSFHGNSADSIVLSVRNRSTVVKIGRCEADKDSIVRYPASPESPPRPAAESSKPRRARTRGIRVRDAAVNPDQHQRHDGPSCDSVRSETLPGILIYADLRARCLARKTLCRDFLPDREEWISGRQSKKGGRAKRTSWFMRKRSTSKKEAGEEASRTRAAQNSSISFARNCDRVEKIRRTASSSEILTPTERIIARIHRSPGSRSVR